VSGQSGEYSGADPYQDGHQQHQRGSETARLYATAAVPSIEEHPLITLEQRAVTA
jgi:hypothetical protein